MKSGFIKLPRAVFELLQNPQRLTRTEALVDLFRRANFRHTRVATHGREVDVFPNELIYSLYGLAESWQWTADEVDEFLEALENSNVLLRHRRSPVTVLQLRHDSSAWQPLDPLPEPLALPKNSFSSSSQEEEEEKESSQERDPIQAEWAEFLRETILRRRLSALSRARLAELRAEFEAARATSSRAAATDPSRRSADDRTSSPSDSRREAPAKSR